MLAGLAARLSLTIPVRNAAAAAPRMSRACGASWTRRYSSINLEQEVEVINEKFVEARDEIEYAQEDAETVRFNESYQAAQAAVSEVLELYSGVLQRLGEEERGRLQRSMGLKMEQLKAELAQLDTLHD